MRKFKVFLVCMLVCFTLSSTFAGCKFEDDDLYDDTETAEELGANPNAPEITLAHWDSSGSLEGAVLNAVLKQFYKSHPNGQKIKVKVHIQGTYETTIPMILGSQDEKKPEIIMIPDGSFNSWIAQFRSQFENLDSYIAKSGFDETALWDNAVSRYKYKNEGGKNIFGEGSTFALPKDVSPNVMFYNKTFFEEKGATLPVNADGSVKRMNTEEAMQLWKKLIVGEENLSAVTRRYALANMFPETMVWSAGSDFLNTDRSAFITEADDITAFKKAYQYMISLVNEKVVPSGASMAGESASALFLTGKTACYIGGAYDAAQFRKAGFDWDISYIPGFAENINVNGYSGSVGYAMYSGTKEQLKDLVYSLIEYISSEEAQIIMAEMGFNIPLQKNITTNTNFIEAQRAKKPYNYEVFLESLKYQPSGTWRYKQNNVWRKKLDTEASKLFQGGAYNVENFVAALPNLVNSSL